MSLKRPTTGPNANTTQHPRQQQSISRPHRTRCCYCRSVAVHLLADDDAPGTPPHPSAPSLMEVCYFLLSAAAPASTAAVRRCTGRCHCRCSRRSFVALLKNVVLYCWLPHSCLINRSNPVLTRTTSKCPTTGAPHPAPCTAAAPAHAAVAAAAASTYSNPPAAAWLTQSQSGRSCHARQISFAAALPLA